MLLTSGNWAWITNAPSPPPWVPGIGREFNPRQSPQPGIPTSTATTITLLTMRTYARHQPPPPAGAIRPGRPAVGSVDTVGDSWSPGGASAGSGGSGAGGTKSGRIQSSL